MPDNSTAGSAPPPPAASGRRLRIMQVIGRERRVVGDSFFNGQVLALHRAGVDQLVVIGKNLTRVMALRAGGIAPVELPFGGWADFSTLPNLRRQAKIYRPDIVVTWGGQASGLFPRGGFLRLARIEDRAPLKPYRRCDHLICSTLDIVEHVAAAGWPRDRAHHVPDFALVQNPPPVQRAAFKTPADVPVVLALGPQCQSNGVKALLQALSIEPRPILWLVGDAEQRNELTALARHLGIPDRIRFLGWREDRESLLAAADLCVIPGAGAPAGRFMLEAWAHRRPVVVAATAGLPAPVHDGADALRVPADDPATLASAMGRVIADGDLPRRLADGGWRRYEAEFTEVGCMARTLALFEGLLEGHARG